MTGTIDVRRLIRVATLALCVVVASVVYFTFAPDVDSASLRVEQALSQVQSDRSTAYRVDALRQARKTLSSRYARLFAQNPEAVFLGDLSTNVARHGLALVSVSEAHDPVGQIATAPPDPSTPSAGQRIALTVEMRGTYRNLLAAIEQLSFGPEIVRVDAPTLRRDGSDVAAMIPVTIFAPATRATSQRLVP